MVVDLKNQYLTVKINEMGAELSSVKDNETGIEYLWQADAEYWGRHAPVLFPIVGRLKDNQYHYAGQTYELSQHGFARDNEFTVIEKTATSATFELVDNDITRAKYPFAFNLRLNYQLNDHTLSVKYLVKNPATKDDLWFQIGGHPAFNVPLTDTGSLDDYQITFGPKEAYQQVPMQDGLTQPAKAFSKDLHQPMALSRQIFDIDTFVFEVPDHETTLMLSTNLNDHGVALTMPADAQYVGVWTPYAKEAPFVAMEPWWGVADQSDTDGDLTHKLAIHQLKPGATFDHGYELRFF